ncbi:ThiF family adenylyltransferase [Muricoccus aerilatus]|uniref:ThiF family adenylyltransferase n=1 Tax=Muricoccus aerilatus TaxID=452982 RepID=UPI0005C12C9A|nr:ThiF family adenylyltransferase [Roseomonas aerilata]
MRPFDYHAAFSRNLGWVRAEEQDSLRARRVAIAGMGGVGGGHLIALARLGIGAFTIADLDRFDLPNMNRQAGAFVSTMDKPKAETLAAMARDVNPELRIRTFPNGVTPENLDDFLDGADLFVDGIDFFAMDIKRRAFARCRELGIPALTAAPIGMGVGLLAFMPTGMSFEQYFRLEGHPEEEQYLRFLLGVAPRGLHRAYLVDPSYIDLANHRGPSTGAACLLCSGAIAAMATRILLLRGGVEAAPVHHHYDAYLQRFVATKLRRGNDEPVQRLKLAVARRQFAAMLRAPRPPEPPATPMEAILEAARWAPSGDNVQPWRFEILGEDAVRVRFDPHDPANPYEYRGGEPSVLSAGMMLEALRIAATMQGRLMEGRLDESTGRLVAELRFPVAAGVEPDSLYALLPLRSVDRRPYRRRPLLPRERAALEAALGPGLELRWHENDAGRLAFARLGAMATRFRLRLPGAHAVHRSAIDWAPGNSRTGIPAGATGLWRPTLPVMRWAIRDWRRMVALNRLGGAHSAALQLDWATALGSAAFFTVALSEGAARDTEGLLAAGAGLLRLWLTATRLGLAMQPGIAVLLCAGMVGSELPSQALRRDVERCAVGLRALAGPSADRLIFLARIGEPKGAPPRQRSVRRPLADLQGG